MSFPVLPHGFLGAQGDSDTYRIERSLRFNSADLAYLDRTPSSAGNRRTFTFSCWIKLLKFSSGYAYPITAGPDSNTVSSLSFSETGSATGTNDLSFFDYQSGSYTTRLISTQVFRDSSAWYHILLSVDTTQASQSDRVKIYINGSQVTSFSTATYPSQNTQMVFNNNVAHIIGAYTNTKFRYSDCYQTETYLIDGQALTPSSFGETDAITGRWKAKAYSGTYGTNGFYLKFADNSGTTATTLGKDSAGTNNWTPNNFVVSPVTSAGNDSLVDSPTNYGNDSGVGGQIRGNYSTLNVTDINSSIALVSNGNLEFTQNSNGTIGIRRSTIAITSGKWYFEAVPANVTAFSTQHTIGIVGTDHSLSNYVGSGANGYAYRPDGNKLNNGTATAYGTTTTANTDVIMVAFDADNWKIWFGKNGTWFASGDPVAGTNAAFSSIVGGTYLFAVGSQHTGFGAATWITNFGQRPFAYTAPSGFKALCTQNLTQPTIQKPSTAMDVVTYTGTGASRSITGLGFSPELVWVKGRSVATNNVLFDIIRGANKELQANNTSSETTRTDALTSFNSDGFSLGADAGTNVNYSGATFVAWSWDAGSTNSTNTSGSITSTVRANPQAGFSIVSFVNASGTNQSTVGHGLGSSPKMIIAKNRDTGANNWAVFHSSVCDTTSKFLQLNTTAALTTFTTVWGASLPSSSVFGVTGGGVGAASVSMIAYCFAEIEGYSKIGSYTGNGSADGPFAWCGFRPRWVMIKNATSGGFWAILDTERNLTNMVTTGLRADSSGADLAGFDMDILSSGFKIRDSETGLNGSGNTIIFAAFAEAPFKYARAR